MPCPAHIFGEWEETRGGDFIMGSVAVLAWLTPITKTIKVKTKQENCF